MEGTSSKNILTVGREVSEMEELRKELEMKISRIEELKRKVESSKSCLEGKKRQVPEAKMEAFKSLVDKYNAVREEHNALLAKELAKLSDN